MLNREEFAESALGIFRLSGWKWRKEGNRIIPSLSDICAMMEHLETVLNKNRCTWAECGRILALRNEDGIRWYISPSSN